MNLAFRLTGRFHWPPRATKPDAKPAETRDGTIEIHFLARDGVAAGQLSALLRWVPRGRETEAAKDFDPPDDELSVLGMTPDTAAQWFLDAQDGLAAIWIDVAPPAKPQKYARWLAFRGAFLFEQCELDRAQAEKDIQWALVAACQFHKGATVFSGLTVDDKGFRLNLQLPLPTPGRLDAGNWTDVAAFAFGAAYDKTAASANVLTARTITVGWNEEDASGPSVGGPTYYELAGDELPGLKKLGEFDFAPGNKGNKKFAKLKGKQGTGTQIGRFWPTDLGAIVKTGLKSYGFNVSAPSNTPNDKTPETLSLRFGKRGLIYRLSLEDDNAATTGDLQKAIAFGFKLKLHDEIGGRIVERVHYGVSTTNDVPGWLWVGNTLSFDFELSWSVDRNHLWSRNRGRDWGANVAIRLHWMGEVPYTFDQDVTTNGHFVAGMLPFAGKSLAAARAALIPSEAGLPHSFIPTLSTQPAGGLQKVRFCLYGEPVATSIDDDGLARWGGGTDGWIRPPMRLSIASKADLIDGFDTGAVSVKIDAKDITFFQTDGVRLELVLDHDPSWKPGSAGAIRDAASFFASYQLSTTKIWVDEKADKPWSGRLGALRFAGFAGTIAEKYRRSGHLRIGGKGDPADFAAVGSILVYPYKRVAVQLRLPLPATRVDQIAVDTRRDDRTGRPAPLLVPLDPPPAKPDDDKDVGYWLTATETATSRQDRWLEADLSEQAAEAGERAFVVLSSEPFSVLKFRHRPLSDRGDAASASVATYSGDDRLWKYKRVAEHYHYSLPPQVVGESADKPRRLEIHDWKDDGEEPPRPFVKPPLPGETEGAGWDLRRRAVEFRLTPSAEIWIKPSDVERGYFMPESASYEIFRQYGEYGLGAALAFLRAEFLYGMPVGVDVSKEIGIARGARVAEIEALTGRLAGPAGTTAEKTMAERWNAVRAAVARRPERLEVWARDLDSAIDFAPARFTDGVRFALRATALHRKPVGEEPTIEPLPDLGGETTPSPAGALRFHTHGLSGGAVWPVESVNLLKILRKQPASNGGVIERIALSPIGGDAAQKAEFLGGKVTIISETRNGHVERAQVEVLGRICAFWHRAKHVVVYERTTNASAQFAPKYEQDPNRTRSRRPILRKVREYIELLQPERGYPDFSSAERRAAGFLERVRFNAPIINVDSAWASDVGDYGWKIPLWNRLSARERPQVYPMPDIAFVTTGEGDGDRPVVAQECLDPDALLFFADFSDTTTSDTNLWPSRLGLDYPSMPAAKTLMSAGADASSSEAKGGRDDVEGRRRSVSRFLPGLKAFTWRLAPAAQKTAINAGRAGKPVYVGLESVTFMRATHAGSLPAETTKLLETSAKISPTSSNAIALAAIDYWKSDGDGSGFADPTKFNKYFGPEGELSEAIKAKDFHKIKSLAGELGANWEKDLKKPLKEYFKSLAPGQYKEDLKDLTSAITSGGGVCAKLRADAIGTIQRKEMLVRTALSDLIGDGRWIFEQVKGVTKAKAIEFLTNEAIDQVRPLFQEASQDVAKLDEGIQKVQATLLDVEAEIDAVFLRAEQRIRAWVAGYDQSKPWSNERRKSFRDGVEACVAGVLEDVRAAIDEARRRMSAELNEITQAIGGHVAKVLSQIEASQLAADTLVASVGDIVDRLTKTFQARLEDLAKTAGNPPEDAIDKLIKKADDKLTGKLENEVKAALEGFKVARDKGLKAIASAQEHARLVDMAAGSALGDVTTLVDKLAGDLKELTTELGSAVDALAAKIKDVEQVSTDLANAIADAFIEDVKDQLQTILDGFDGLVAKVGDAIDAVVLPTFDALERLRSSMRDELQAVPAKAGPIIEDVRGVLDAAMKALQPDQLVEQVVRLKVVAPLAEAMIAPLPEDLSTVEKEIIALLEQFAERVGAAMGALSDNALGAVEGVTAVCQGLYDGVEDVTEYLQGLASGFEQMVDKKLQQVYDRFAPLLGRVEEFANDADQLLAALNGAGYAIRGIQNDLSRAYESAHVYADRVFDQIGKLDDGGLTAAPSNILKLYSAVTTAPQLAALKADIDRIRAGFDDLADVIDTTKANALFNRLGDELKGLGLSLPFDKIGDRLLPADLSDLDIGKVFRNFGGAKLDRLFQGYKVPAGVRDAVKVTHDFDQKQARAWVQIDIDAPMPGRRSLFSVGVFKADFVDMRLVGQVRLEASKDQDKVTQTGFGRIGAVIDLVVGGQTMVSFTKFGLAFTKDKGLEIEFDPSGIRLNPQFQFIQDFLSTLFGGEPGGLKIIKEGGLPVGVEHEYLIPPLALNFGTSGVSNISIENRFRLVAYPDFMLADRFNLSTVERPFIFSIFIIGGTGYIQIEAQYRPFDNELSVLVEAGAGGSASLAFAFGPFVGQVFITLSGALSYRKTIGKPGGGLAISVVLVIAGHVSVAGIVTVGITLMLRMTYRDTGQVDGDGTLSVTIRISRFFKLTARANVKYKLRGGKAETEVTTKVDEPAELKKIQDAAKKLQGARA